MRKLRTLIGMPVVVQNRRIGRVVQAALSEDLTSLDGLWVDEGLRGTRLIPSESLEMLGRIASHLENDTRLKIKHLLSLFEPAVIVFLALMVLVVVVSIFVAMMEINSINQGGSQL